MSTVVNLNVRANLATELNEEEVATLTENLVRGLSEPAVEIVSATSKTFRVAKDPGYLQSEITVEVTKDSTAEVLESLIEVLETRADAHSKVAAGWGPDEADQAPIDYGLAEGYRGAAEFAREALGKL